MKIYAKILSIFLSAVLIVNVTVIPTVAKNDEINENSPIIKEENNVYKSNGAEEAIKIVVNEEEMEDCVFFSDYTCFSSDVSENEWDISNHFGYDYLGKLDNGPLMQSIYMDLYRFNVSFLNNSNNVSPTSVSGSSYYIICSVYNPSYKALSNNELFEAYFAFKNDFPQFFWTSSVVLVSSGKIYQVIYEDFANGEVRQRYNQKFRKVAEGIINNASGFCTNYEKALYVHNAICRNNTYANEEDGITPVDNGFSHSVIGALCNNSSVCDGYAKAFQYIMNRLGVDCLLITGDAGGSHAWNMLQMDDEKYYFVDLTWDDLDSTSVDVFYKYFMPSGTEFLSTHTPLSPSKFKSDFASYLPEISEDDSFSFYKKEGVCINEYSLENYAFAVRNSFELLSGDAGYTVGYIDFSENISDEQKNEMLQYLTSFASMLECSDGFKFRASFSFYQNTYFYKLRKLSCSEDTVLVYKNDELYGSYKTLTGAIEDIKDDGSAYTIKLCSNSHIYPNTKFPETSSLCFESQEYVSSDLQSYYSVINVFSDITFNCNIAMNTITLVGYGLFGEEEVKNIYYTNTFDILNNGIYLYNINIQCSKPLIAGDINEDGVLNSQDLLIIQCHVLGISVLPSESIPTIDANSDGVFDSTDLLILQMLILQS